MNGEDNGFAKLLADWEKRAREYDTLTKQTQEEITTLETHAGETIPMREAPPVSPKRPPETIPSWHRYIGGVPPEAYEPRTRISYPWQRVEIKNEALRLSEQLEKNDFYYRLFSEVPYVISSGKAATIEDILVNLPLPTNITTGELEEIESTISGMISAITGRTALPEMAAEVEGITLPGLLPPVPPPQPIGIQRITVQEILKSLAAPVVPPAVLSDGEWKTLLYDSGQVEKEGDVISLEEEADRLIASWQERNNMLDSFRQGIAEMPDYTVGDLLKEAVIQPGLMLMAPLNWYFEHVSQPLAGLTYQHFFPDLEVAYEKFQKTESTWMAASHAWKEWDTNWFLKYMIMENLTDPMTYVGWGIATRLTKQVPYVGKLVGAAERGIAEIMEMPFTALKAGLKKLPTTITQRAFRAQHEAGQLFEKYITKYTGKFFHQVTMKDWGEAAEAAVKYLAKHPQADDEIANAARQLLKHIPVDEVTARGWAKTLGSTLGPEDITRVTVLNVDELFEDMFTRKMLAPREAGARLIGILGGENTDDMLKLAQSLLETRAGRIANEALVFGRAKGVYEAMRALMKRNFRYHIATEESLAALARTEVGRFSTLLFDIGTRTQGIWRNYVEKIVVRTFAEAYLTFGMYGPMNVLEDYMRSALGGVFPRRMDTRSWERLSWGLIADPNMKQPGISEMVGYLAREGTEDGWNNWVLQLATLGKKDWAEKVYTALVRIPGAYGMDVRRNFVGGRYMQLLVEAGGETAEALAKAAPKMPRTIPKKLAKQLEAEVYRMSLTGQPDLIRGAKDLFTRANIMKQEVKNILTDYPELPNTARSFILDQYNRGTLFAEGAPTIERTVTDAGSMVMDEFLRGPEYATKQFDDLAKVLTDLDVANPEDMAQLLRSTSKMSEIYGATPKQILAQASIHSRGLPFAERSTMINKSLDEISVFMDRAGASIDRVVEKARVTMPGIGVTDDYITASSHLFDMQTAKRVKLTELRSEMDAWRREFFSGLTASDLRKGATWDDFYLQLDGHLTRIDTSAIEYDGLLNGAREMVDAASGIKPISRPPIRITDRALAPQDVATLIGVRGDDVSRAMLDVLTAQNSKPHFVAYVMGKTRPNDVGFTKEAVGQVYDQIALSLGVKPETVSWITSKQLQLEGVRRELHELWNAKLLPDDQIASIGKYIDDTADAVGNVMYKEGVIKPEFADYDTIRQKAMDEAHQWYYKEYTDYTNANVFDSMMKTIYPYWSISEDTEVLSRKGWKHYWELSEEDELLSFDKDTELTYWDKVQYINVYDYDGEAIHIKNIKSKDFICTPNHWWLVKRQRKQDWEFVEASNLQHMMRLPKAANHYYEGESVLTPDEAAILGWSLTDGTWAKKYGIYIQQYKPKYVDEIRNLLNRNDCLHSEGIYNEVHHFRLTLQFRDFLYDKMDELGLMYIVTHLSKEASESMWIAMYHAEGREDGSGFVQNEGIVLDAFESLSFLTGRFVTRLQHTPPNRWYLYPHKSKSAWLRSKDISSIQYKGKMWCPRVEHRTILIRRNNKVTWTGNTYESQRWFWLPRAVAKHPGLLTNYGRWQNNTDYGYVHVPGTSIDINPARGTVFGLMSTRMVRRDYPEYYDALPFAGGYVEFMDFLSRYGFYPGAHLGIPLAIMGGREAQVGEVLPAMYKTGLDAMIAMFPDSEAVAAISSTVFNDRFRDYLTVKEVGKRGGNGTIIFAKIKANEELTAEEQAMWNDSRKEVSWYSAGFEQFGLFRMRSDEQYAMYENASKAIEEMTGYTSDQQDWLRKHGYRLWDMVGGMSPTEQIVLQELDYYRWVGSVRPLLPGRQQEILNQIELGWDEVRVYTEGIAAEKLELQRDFLSGARGPQDYNDMLIGLYMKQGEYIDQKIKEIPLMDIDNRKDYYKEYNIPQPVLHPMRELLNLYFNIDLEETIDPETGEKTRDWDKFWSLRDAIEEAVPPHLKQEWDDYIVRNSTRIEQVRRDVYQDYFKTYNQIWQTVLETFNIVEQQLVDEFLYLEKTGQNLARQAEIQNTTREDGRRLISSFRSDVTNARKALRYANPTLDAWLFYWGRVGSFTTPQAEQIYYNIAQDTGRKI